MTVTELHTDEERVAADAAQDAVAQAPGRREARKRATRAAIDRAARELFAARGFDAVPVREIAAAAGVTERTFYRYYPDKHELVAGDAQAWADTLRAAIRARPPQEAPLEAVEHALVEFARALADRPAQAPAWLLHRRPRPFEVLGQSDPRALLRFEEAIAGALRDRSQQPAAAGQRDRDDCELLARVSVAVIRTAAIRRRALELDGQAADAAALLEQEFARLMAVTQPPQSRAPGEDRPTGPRRPRARR